MATFRLLPCTDGRYFSVRKFGEQVIEPPPFISTYLAKHKLESDGVDRFVQLTNQTEPCVYVEEFVVETLGQTIDKFFEVEHSYAPAPIQAPASLEGFVHHPDNILPELPNLTGIDTGLKTLYLPHGSCTRLYMGHLSVRYRLFSTPSNSGSRVFFLYTGSFAELYDELDKASELFGLGDAPYDPEFLQSILLFPGLTNESKWRTVVQEPGQEVTIHVPHFSISYEVAIATQQLVLTHAELHTKLINEARHIEVVRERYRAAKLHSCIAPMVLHRAARAVVLGEVGWDSSVLFGDDQLVQALRTNLNSDPVICGACNGVCALVFGTSGGTPICWDCSKNDPSAAWTLTQHGVVFKTIRGMSAEAVLSSKDFVDMNMVLKTVEQMFELENVASKMQGLDINASVTPDATNVRSGLYDDDEDLDKLLGLEPSVSPIQEAYDNSLFDFLLTETNLCMDAACNKVDATEMHIDDSVSTSTAVDERLQEIERQKQDLIRKQQVIEQQQQDIEKKQQDIERQQREIMLLTDTMKKLRAEHDRQLEENVADMKELLEERESEISKLVAALAVLRQR